MAIALTLQEYLEHNNIVYDILSHAPTVRSRESAHAAHVPGGQLVKGVILKNDLDYLMVVMPSTHYVNLLELDRELDTHFRLVDEEEIENIFTDCALGAIPPVGQPYYIDMVVDQKLLENSDIYFEAGDHASLVHVTGDNFKKLVRNSKYCQLS